MADYMIKGETLTNIANAIRAKSGSSATMTPEQMSTEIENISTGGGDIDALIDGSLTEITSNVTSIKQYAFSGCNSLTSVSFPNVTFLREYALSGCGSLANIEIPNATSIGAYALSNCYELTNIEIPNATSIGAYAFSGCSRLNSITIPASVTSIGAYAFASCGSLKNIEIPNLITSIDNSVFYQCYRLISVIIPSVTSIGNLAFANCYSLKKLIIGVNSIAIASLAYTNVFNKCYHILGTVNTTYNPNGDKDGFIYVPNNLVADYRAATNWSTYASQIFPWVATVEELANIDSTTYTRACVGTENNGTEYTYNGTSWEVVA